MANVKQNADNSLSVVSDVEGVELLRLGGPSNPLAGGTSANLPTGINYRGNFTLKIPVNTGTANITAGCALVVNPFNVPLQIGLTTIRFVTGQDVTFSISVGTGTMSQGIEPKGSSNNLIDTYNYNTANTTPNPNNIDNNGSNGLRSRILGVGEAIMVTTNRQIATAQLFVYANVSPV